MTITAQSCIYWHLFNCYRLKIDFVMQFYVFPVKFCQTDILQLCPKLTISLLSLCFVCISVKCCFHFSDFCKHSKQLCNLLNIFMNISPWQAKYPHLQLVHVTILWPAAWVKRSLLLNAFTHNIDLVTFSSSVLT